MLKEINMQGTQKKKAYKNKHKIIRKIPKSTYISIITLNLNGLNAPTKRKRLAK